VGFKAEPTATALPVIVLSKEKNEFETDLQTITSTLTRIPLGSERGRPGPRRISGSATPTPDPPLSVTPLSSDASEGRRFCIARAAMVFLFREPLGRPRPRFGSSTTQLLVKFNGYSKYLLTCRILARDVALFKASGGGTAG
jgi:hypothetical protein